MRISAILRALIRCRKSIAMRSGFGLFFVAMLLLIPAQPVCGQGLSFRYYDGSSGLAGIFVRDIAQDHQGYMWFATFEGLCRYDGVSFKTYSAKDGLTGNHICALRVDVNGSLWIGTRDAGLFIYDGKSFQPLSGEHAPPLNEMINVIFEDAQGAIWIGTRNGLYRYSNGQFSRWSTAAHLQVFSIFQDRDQSMLLGTNQGLLRFSEGAFENYGDQCGIQPGLVRGIVRDAAGNLLVGTMTGISRIQDDRAKEIAGPVACVKNLLIDGAGDVWVAAMQGLFKLQGDTLTSYAEKVGGLDHATDALFEDHEGNMWFGSVYGVRVLVNEAFISYLPEKSPWNRGVHCVAVRNDGSVIAVNHDTVFEIRDQTMTVLGQASLKIISILETDQSKLLFGNLGESLLQYSRERGALVEYEVSAGVSKQTRLLYQDPLGALWIALAKRVHRIHGSHEDIFPLNTSMIC